MSTLAKSLVCAAVAVLTFAGPVSAEWLPITVENPSFETPNRGDGLGGFMPEWNGWGTDTGRYYNPTSPVFDGTNGQYSNSLGILPDGYQIAVLHVPEPEDSLAFDYRLLQTTDHEIVAGETYELSFYYGARTAHASNKFASFTASLLDGDNDVVGSLTISTSPPLGSFVSTSFTATANASHTGYLKISFVGGAYPGTGYGQEFIDLVTLSYQPIPEPNTLALLSAGLIGLLCYAWRKRK